jgi:hypothetical protein
MEKIFGPGNKKTFKFDLDIMETSILWNFFSVPSTPLYRGSNVAYTSFGFSEQHKIRIFHLNKNYLVTQNSATFFQNSKDH